MTPAVARYRALDAEITRRWRQGDSTDVIAAALGLPEAKLLARAAALGLWSGGGWPPALVLRLRALWADPAMTAADIGKLLGKSAYGVTNKAHRLQLEPRPSPIRRRTRSACSLARTLPGAATLPPLPSLADLS